MVERSSTCWSADFWSAQSTKSGHEPLKCEFVFRQDFATMQELRDGTVRFRDWYNQVRLHSALGYACPWAKLLEAAKSRNAA